MMQLQLFIIVVFSLLHVRSDTIAELPFCEQSETGIILVSTIDGLLSALKLNGDHLWGIQTEPGPLLSSNIHKLELTNSGQWIRIIPSLSGTLYKFNGVTVDPIHMNADTLLTSSFKYSDDLVIAGGRDVRTYGVNLYTGTHLYQCSWQGCNNTTEGQDNVDDVIVIERKTHIVRAIEPRTGNERWNFSVGEHNVKFPRVSCINYDRKSTGLNISAVIPEGILIARNSGVDIRVLWQYQFQSPIAAVWRWDGHELVKLNLFERVPFSVANNIDPAIYLGMHNKQLYIHESTTLQNALVASRNRLTSENNHHFVNIPWKPFSASNSHILSDDENSTTALSVLYGSDYVNGNGYYLYNTRDIEERDNVLCESNGTVITHLPHASRSILSYCFNRNASDKKDVIFVERQVRIPSTSSTDSDLSTSLYTSRYESDFEPLNCLGRGGFGIVFKVKKKFDECNYAIKRITLPNDAIAKERMMREVKALAKLDHKHIVRYYNAWLESPPPGWQTQHDQKWIGDYSSSLLPNASEKSQSGTSGRPLKIDVPSTPPIASKYVNANTDSYIIFENDSKSNGESGKADTVTTDLILDHSSSSSNTFSSDKTMPFIKDQTFLYIQMQLCHHESLKDWLRTNSSRNISNVLQVFEQIVEAVEYVHLRGLIHRDLKPSNIFFSLDGQVKVGDFGLVTGIKDYIVSTEVDSLPSATGYTKAVGTHLYMSPEQFEGREYNYKVDIYSLGIILFELLVTFATEMERVDVIANLRKHIFPNDFATLYPKEYELLKVMLSNNPEKRPTATGIRARPPLEKEDAISKHQYHFNLPMIEY